MKAPLKQPFRTFELLSMLVLVMTVMGISGTIISREMVDVDRRIAMSEAENLAFQIVSGRHIKRAGSRGPASLDNENILQNQLFGADGQIGKDPWGHPFHYKIVQNDSGQSTHVVIWSKGPNSKGETEFDQLHEINGLEEISFQGDDFGYVHPIDLSVGVSGSQ